MDDGNGGQFSTIYDGSKNPGVISFLKSGLTNGLLFRFRVYGVNFNGLSEPSESAQFYACTAPVDFLKPKIVA